jgi:cell division protein FtsA
MARSKSQPSLITGLDIGSSAIRIAVGQTGVRADGKKELQIIATAEAPSEGLQKGVIVSIEEAVSSISSALEQIERMTGIPITNVWIGISGMHILSQKTRGVVAVAKPDGEISDEDVNRAVDAAKTIAAPLNYEMLHLVPRHFSVDGQLGIKDPVGMTGIRLEVEAQAIYGLTSHLKNMTKAVYRTSVGIDAVVLSVLATADAVLNTRQKELGVLVVDLGGSTTTLLVYEGGNVIHTAVLPIGSDHITNDLALGLQTSIDVAEKVKIQVGSCINKNVSKQDVIDLFDFGNPTHEEVSLLYITEIIHARVSEILERIDKELVSVDQSGMLPAGVIFIGGGSKIGGLVELSKQKLRMNAALGFPLDIRTVTEKANDVSFAPAIGLVKWGSAFSESSESKRTSSFLSGGPQKFVENVRKVFRFLVP